MGLKDRITGRKLDVTIKFIGIKEKEVKKILVEYFEFVDTVEKRESYKR